MYRAFYYRFQSCYFPTKQLRHKHFRKQPLKGVAESYKPVNRAVTVTGHFVYQDINMVCER